MTDTPADKPFDYGKKLPDGQHERHPVKDDGKFIRPIRTAYMHEKCSTITHAPEKVAETIARDPQFYGKMSCAHCGEYFRCGGFGEFVWLDENDRPSAVKVGQ